MRDRVSSGETGLKLICQSNQDNPTSALNQSGSSAQVHERRLQRVMHCIESGMPHSVRELAQEVHLSPTHLQRLFKEETGVHISGLLTERRLSIAAHLLTTTQMGVKEIAYRVGYGHHSSFVRAFQRRFGQPPKRYREACA